MTIQIAVRRLPHNTDLPLPAYATAGAAGMDLLAAVEASVIIEPGGRVLIPTGLAIALPPGYELQIHPPSKRSRNDRRGLSGGNTGDRAERGRCAVYRRTRRTHRSGSARAGGPRV